MKKNFAVGIDDVLPVVADYSPILVESAKNFENPTCYLSPKLEGRECWQKGARGVFVRDMVLKRELLAVWGGEVVSGEQLSLLPAEVRSLSVQVEENLFFLSSKPGPADWINHSCDPNAGLCGQATLIALREISPGEEVCFDYAMSDGCPYDEFDCQCGSPRCRGRITGEDWRRPDLWSRYIGHFSPYLQRRIDQIRARLLS